MIKAIWDIVWHLALALFLFCLFLLAYIAAMLLVYGCLWDVCSIIWH